MEYANQIRIAGFGLGYKPNDYIIRFAIEEWNKANSERAYYQSFLDEILAEEARWEQRMKEYPEATIVWLYLKDLGYSDYVCAGILGNMMVECGGNTLALQATIIGNNQYYGICQWSKTYHPAVWGKNLQGQLDYLRDNIQVEFKSFGKLYKRGFTYEKFLAMEDCQLVALAFTKVYERCGSKYYHIRKNCAVIAYNYYTSSD